MSDKKEDTEYECTVSPKYDKMGVTPRELYFRQQGRCVLQFAYDEIDGELVPGGLYCTDGSDFALFGSMLNPTFECIQCVTNFVMNEARNKMVQGKLDKFIVSLLVGMSESRQKTGEAPVFHMSKKTFDLVENHIYNTAMFSDETNPIKVTAKGGMLLLGCDVEFLDMEEGVIKLEPGDITLRAPNEKKA